MRICLFYISLLIACFFIRVSTSLAQSSESKEIVVAGKIISSDSLTPIPLAHVSNKNKTRGTVADVNGIFQIKVNILDTLYFSAVGFQNGILHFNDSSQKELRSLVVLMTRKTYELQPVDIHAYNIADILNKAKEKPLSIYRKDTAAVKWEKPKRNESIGLSGGNLEGAVTAFANLFNDDYQERKKLKQILEVEDAQRKLETEKAALEKRYKDLSKEATGLAGVDLDHFIEFSNADLNFLRSATDYQITARVLDAYKAWRYKYKFNDMSLNELLDNAKFRK